MKRSEALKILREDVQGQSYLSWLEVKKGVLPHNKSLVAENQDLIQEFTTLMRYVAHQLPKLRGVEITMDQAAQVVSSHVIGFDFMIVMVCSAIHNDLCFGFAEFDGGVGAFFFLCGGLGPKPQLLLCWFGTTTTTILCGGFRAKPP